MNGIRLVSDGVIHPDRLSSVGVQLRIRILGTRDRVGQTLLRHDQLRDRLQ